jgi:flagellar hook-associated protein FlgK
MSNLLLLQNAYSANARVISTIQDLFNVLMSIGR